MVTGRRPDLAGWAAVAWRWWSGQLSALLPQPLRALLLPERPLLVVDLTGETAKLRRYSEGRPSAVGTGPGSLLSRPAEVARHRVVALLPPGELLRRRLWLPAAAERDLQRLLAFELERQSPLPAEEVSFTHRLLARDRQARRIEVELLIARRTAIERVRAACRVLGLAPDEIREKDEAVPLAGAGGFTLQRSRAAGGRLWRWSSLSLALLVVLLGLALLAVEAARDRAEIGRLAEQLERLRGEALAAGELRRDLEAAEERLALLDARRRSVASIALLAEVALTLPDDTWLFELEREPETLRLRGYAPAAAALIERLEGAPLLTNVQFAAPVTQAPRGQGERFDFRAEIAGGQGP